MKGIEGSDERRASLDQLIDERRKTLRLRWSQLARRAGMTQENLLRIRKNRISISWEAAAGIERALLWEPGSVEAAVLHGEHPRVVPATSAGSSERESEAYPPGWTSAEEADYQVQYPKWNLLLQTQGMEFTRHAYRHMREEFRKLRALEQFTQRAWSDEDSDQSTRSRDT